MPQNDPNEYRTESGHAPGEVTPDGVGVLHGNATAHKQRKLIDGSMHHGSAAHFDAAQQRLVDEIVERRVAEALEKAGVK